MELSKTILGVKGAMNELQKWPNGLYRTQSWTSTWREYKDGGTKCRLRVTIRFDDNCQNKHQSFAITASGDEMRGGGWLDSTGGCCHDEIAKVFPELKPLIQWHLHSTDGAMHGVANAVYHAGNRDHNGLLKGEVSQIIGGRTGKPCWKVGYRMPDGTILDHYRAPDFQGVDLDDAPALPEMIWQPMTRTGEGKERQLDYARGSFPTCDLPDDVLMLDSDKLREHLTGLLPKTIADFRAAMETIGFVWVAL